MSRETFQIVCNELRPHLQRQVTRFRHPVTVEARVAVTIWRLATNIEYRTIAALFGLGRSTVGEIVIDTCEAINTQLMSRYIRVPHEDSLQDIVDGFRHQWGFPQAIGAIDGTHIPILRPQESASDYYNRKGYYSVLMQGVVDFRGLFMDVNIGWPGKVHDARVLVNSSFYRKCNSGIMFPDWRSNLGGLDVPLVILGDPAYPLMSWLIKPYLENSGTTPQERYFNYRLSRARMVVENSFGRLKGRWRCLMKRIDAHISNVPGIVGACVVLHNMCEIYGDHCLQEWMVSDVSSPINHHPASSVICTNGNSVRDAIRDHIYSV